MNLSPTKRKRDRAADTSKFVEPSGYAVKRAALQRRLFDIQQRVAGTTHSSPGFHDAQNVRDVGEVGDMGTQEAALGVDALSEAVDVLDLAAEDYDESDVNGTTFSSKPPRRTMPDDSDERLYQHWRALLPSLIRPMAAFQEQFQENQQLDILPLDSSGCSSLVCQMHHTTRTILCLFWNRFEYLDFTFCPLSTIENTLQGQLVMRGLFPTAPQEPRMAVSIQLLELYLALVKHAGASNTAIAAALNDTYTSRGFWIRETKGAPIHEPFRRGLGYAAQWFALLKRMMSKQFDDLLTEARRKVSQSERIEDDSIIHVVESSSELGGIDEATGEDDVVQYHAPTPASSTTQQIRDHCSDLLQRRCPACFGGVQYGRTFAEGADVHAAVDLNFHHRHKVSAGDSPHFYEPDYFISKKVVDAAGDRVLVARSRKKKAFTPRIPDVAVDEDEKSFVAADEKKEKTSGERFDDTGVAALVCRHDIPIFLANVDTPGEQQKYAVALIDEFISHLPQQATVAILYDIGCVLDRSVHLYDIFAPSVTSRLIFATSAMHAYGHQWSCQLVYNPRLRSGLGLTDGEGVERLWSRLRKLIGITRSSGRRRRIYLLDQQADFITEANQLDLGRWIVRKLKQGVEKKGAKARAELESTGQPITYFREQWTLQREAQISIRAHAPARLKKELDAVLALQAQADTVEKLIETMKEALQVHHSSPMPPESMATPAQSAATNASLAHLYSIHHQFTREIDQLYATLTVSDKFPELAGLDAEFVRHLLLARDLKINIRKRAIGTFFEWDRIDRAVGGKEQALGTKLHQKTRQSISKRKPALVAAIRKFNSYVANLQKLATTHDITFTLPKSLPTEIGHLKNNDDILQDVWIDPVSSDPPPWLVEVNVRKGIRAMLSLDRCLEERRRLGREAENLLRYFQKEVLSLEVLSQSLPNDSPLHYTLLRRYEKVLNLQYAWANPFISSFRWTSCQQFVVDTSRTILAGGCASIWTFVQDPLTNFVENPLYARESGFDAPVDDSEDERDDGECFADMLEEEECEREFPDTSGNNEMSPTREGLQLHISMGVDCVQEYYAQQSVDIDIASSSLSYSDLPSIALPRYRPAVEQSTRSIVFDAATLQRLATSDAFLNDDAINGCSTIFRTTALNFALFLTYDLAVLHHSADCDLMEKIWRYTKHLTYWECVHWLIPIHRKDQFHWTVAFVDFQTCTIDLFDSLADEEESQNDIKDVTVFLRLTFAAAQKAGKSCWFELQLSKAWNGHILNQQPLQYNGYDCGVWVLAQIHARLSGYCRTGMTHEGMAKYRAYCLKLCLQLPIYQPE